ncbi:MAG: PQQ-binding-like beta-propeller repeat protein [bacterium]|nr:PQQ-binding-like beta-propeller repeat protein [bacterium]
MLWDKDYPLATLTLAANESQIVFFSGQKLVALSPQTGAPLWTVKVGSLNTPSRNKTRTPDWISAEPPRLILHDHVILLGLGSSVRSFAATDGKPLWNAPYPASGYASPRDLFIIDDLAWWGDTAGAPNSGRFWGRDIVTGAIKASFEPQDESIVWLSHHRCHISKATCNYILPARMGIEFVDLKKQTWQENHWVRGGCLYGAMPANGLLYAPPHACACYFETKLNGFHGLTSATDKGERISAAKRLEKGPAFDSSLANTKIRREEDWPMFRGDSTRSGSSSTSISDNLRQKWNCAIGTALTQPVISDGRLLIAARDAHTVRALDAESGKKLWSFTAGGRIDSPPTIHKGRAVFGCRDGWVYCVTADRGELVWRYRAMPYESLIMVYGQLESAWPVSGSVLIVNDEVHCVAGRNMFLDGGLRYLRLDLATGRAIAETVMDRTDPIHGGTIQKYDSWLDMTTTLPDVLSCDGHNVFMRSLPFDLQGKRRRITHIAAETEPAHLFSPTGYLDDTWFHRSYWTYGRTFPGGWIGHLNPGRYNPSGRLLVMDKENVYGYGRKPDYYRWTTALEYRLFAVKKRTHETKDIYAYDKFKANQLEKFPEMKIDRLMQLPSGNKPKTVPRYDTVWEDTAPSLLVRAMVASKQKLLVAGPEDISDEGLFSFTEARNASNNRQALTDASSTSDLKEQAEVWNGKGGATLLTISKQNGKTLSSHHLDSLPVFDGMIVADGKVFVATTEGSVVCLCGE